MLIVCKCVVVWIDASVCISRWSGPTNDYGFPQQGGLELQGLPWTPGWPPALAQESLGHEDEQPKQVSPLGLGWSWTFG